MVKAKILNYNETSTDYKEISANIYLDDNWNDVLNTEVCSEKHELSKRIKKLAVPYNGDWSK